MSKHDKPLHLQSRLIDIDGLKHISVREGIALRLLSVDDAEEVLSAIDSDLAIRKYVYVASLMRTPEDVKQQVASMYEDGELLRYVIIDQETIVGMINFWRAGDFFGALIDPDVCGFGYFLVPSARGKGILSDALTKLIDVAKQTIPIPEFIAFCEDENDASRAVLERVGFKATDELIDFSKLGAKERKYVFEN